MRGTLPAGIQGPFFNDDFGDVYGVIYALEADGFSYAELKTFADDVRQQLLRVQDVAKVELFGVQDEKVFVELSQKRAGAAGPRLQRRCWRSSDTQNAVESAGAIQSPQDVVQVRVARPVHERWSSCARCRSAAAPGNQLRAGRHRGGQARLRRSAGRQGAAPGQGSDRARRLDGQGRRHHRARQGAAARPPASIDKQLPAGMELAQVQDQPRGGARLGQRVRARADRGGRDRAGGELHRLGLHKRGPLRWYIDIRPGLVVAHHDPAGAGGDLPGDELLGHRAAQDLARLADHRAGPAGGRRDHRGRDDGAQDGGGLRQGARRHLRLRGHADADADRHADHGRRLPADRPGQVGDRRVHLRDLRGDRRSRWCSAGSSRCTSCPTWARCCSRSSRTTDGSRASRTSIFDTPFYRALPPRGGLVRGAPLDHHRRHAC